MLAGGTAGPGDSMTAPGSAPSAPLEGQQDEPPAATQDFRHIVKGRSTGTTVR